MSWHHNGRWFHREAGQEVKALGGYAVILADPSWAYRVEGGRGAADKHYETMSLAEQCLLPVHELAAENSVCFMWGVWPQLLEAYALMKCWGFQYLNCGFNWVKVNTISPTPFVGLGHWTRGNSEFCLFGKRGKPVRVDAAVQQIIADDLIVAPIGEHSEKPAEVRSRIERLMGDVPRLEMFSRIQAPGWDSFGDQMESTVVLLPQEPHEEAHLEA